MKKRRALTLIALTALLTFSGCKKEETTNPFDYVALGQYKGVEVTLETSEVTEEEISTRIDKILSGNLEYLTVTRAAQKGDKIMINVTGEIDGKANAGFTSNDYEFVMNEDVHIMDGFVDQLYGNAPGEDLEFKLTVPDTFSDQTLVGKEVSFFVSISTLKEPKALELTDEVVAQISEKKTVDEYKEYIRGILQKEKDMSSENSKKVAALKAAIENSEILKYPEGAIEDQIAEIQEKYNVYATLQKITVDEYIQNQVGNSVEEYAEDLVKEELVLAAIQKQEKITLSNDEYKEKLPAFAEKYSIMSEEAFEDTYGKETIKQAMLWDKTMDFLVDNAVIK